MEFDAFLKPFGLQVDFETGVMHGAHAHVERRLSNLTGLFEDIDAYEAELRNGDPIIYEMYEIETPKETGHLLFSIDTIFPGQIGTEYHMTKGHQHTPSNCVEIYVGLQGNGLLLLQNDEGDFQAEDIAAGRMIYVAPGYIHRTVNTGHDPLRFLTIYPAQAKADYSKMPEEGMLFRVKESGDGPTLVKNSEAR